MSPLQGVELDNNDVYDVPLLNAGDITGATVQARLKLVGSNPPITRQLGAAVEDGPGGVIRLTLASGALPHGRWSVQWQVTYQDGTVLTWPARGRDYLLLGRKN